MASRTGILLVAFLSLALLPLLSSAFYPGIIPHPHAPLLHPINPEFGQLPLQNDDSAVLIEPVNMEQPSEPAPEQLEERASSNEPAPERPENESWNWTNKPAPVWPDEPAPEQPESGASPYEPPPEQPENGAQSNETAPERPENGAQSGEPAPEQPENGVQSGAPAPEQPENGAQSGAPAPEQPGNGAQPGEPARVTEGLKEVFYEQSCPQAEKIVNETIHEHFRKDPTLAAGIVRLFFHDCFVTGCDASVLLDQTPTGEEVEKNAPQNGKFLRGFEAIDDIKSQLEAECPGMVSCADILAFVNRDSLVFTGVPRYEVAAGRRDGLSSLAKNAEQGLPFPDTSPEENIRLFQNKGLSLEDLVLLLGAHSIGSAHCGIVSGRFHDPVKSKEIDPGYLFKMQTLAVCQSEDQTLPFDPLSQQKMDSRYYKELLTNKALIESDHRLAKEPHSRNIMQRFADDQTGWLAKFTAVMKKLGEIEVLTGNQGEIRRQCRTVN